MGLFKSKQERRIERDMKIRAGLKSIERAIHQQEKFAADFIKNAQHAQRINDTQQYTFIRQALKRTAGMKRLLERQLLCMKNAMLVGEQAQATQQFCQSMELMSRQISEVFSAVDMNKSQVQWQQAMSQAASIEQRAELFIDSIETAPVNDISNNEFNTITDDDIDRMINADVLAEQHRELASLTELDKEITRELSSKQKD
jgi:hypothetical protein